MQNTRQARHWHRLTAMHANLEQWKLTYPPSAATSVKWGKMPSLALTIHLLTGLSSVSREFYQAES